MYRARCGGPRTPSRTTDVNLDCAFVEKNAPFFLVTKIGGLSLRPTCFTLLLFVALSELSNSGAFEHVDVRFLPYPPSGLDDSLAHPPP